MRLPRWKAKALGYGSDWARTRRARSSAGQFQSIRMSSAERLWNRVASERSCGVNSVCPAAIRPSAPVVTGPMRSTVLWKRSVAVSAGPTVTASCRDDVAGVELVVHHVRGDAHLGLAVDQRPDQRGEPGVLRQQRVVDVQRAVAREGEDAWGDPRPPVAGHDDVRVGLPEALEQLVVVRAVAYQHRDAPGLGEVGDGVAPDLLVRVLALGMRHDQHHVVLGVQEGLQSAVAPGLVPEHDDPHE